MYIPTWHNINTDLKAASVFLRHIQRGQYLFQDSFYQPVKTICISPYGNKQSMRMLGNASLKCWKRAITLTFQDQNLVLLTISKTLYGFKQARKFWGIPNSNLLGLTKHIFGEISQVKKVNTSFKKDLIKLSKHSCKALRSICRFKTFW